jgi:hypothetical protein
VFTHYFRFSCLRAREQRRAPLLERLLARADSSMPATDWRADAFRLLAPGSTPMPGVGAAAVYAEVGAVSGATVFVASPVHYLVEMSNVRLAADGILSLRQAEAGALADEFNRVWHGAGIRLLAGSRAELFCITDRPLPASTQDPEDVLGQHIEMYLPTGEHAPRLRRLMSEIEMWLFEHDVNRARRAGPPAAGPPAAGPPAAGTPAISGLWLWGAGPALTSLPQVSGWTAGNDLLFNALAARRGPQPGISGVAAVAAEPGTEEWREIESWLEGSLADLRARRIGRLLLSAGKQCFSLSSNGTHRFWRRGRPWWESFA